MQTISAAMSEFTIMRWVGLLYEDMQHAIYGAGLNSDQPCNTSILLGMAI
jgi:hypothetical protein